ncbi:unnamed protein product [Mucor hiemalis]
MELEYDGDYRSKIAEKCRTIKDRDDMLILFHGISLMIYLENKLSKLTIVYRQLQDAEDLHLVKP